jgi:hypothetical protein
MAKDFFILLKVGIRAIVLLVMITILVAFFLPPIVYLGSFVYSFSEDLWLGALARLL